VTEVDGAYFGGYVRPANLAEKRRDRRKLADQSGKRQSAIIVREHRGNSVAAAFKPEGTALALIKSRISKGTPVQDDEASAWNALKRKYEMKRINYQEVQPGWRLHQSSRKLFLAPSPGRDGPSPPRQRPVSAVYAQESAWREDARRVDNGAQGAAHHGTGPAPWPVSGFRRVLRRHIKAI
jgi:hypothetical protein